MKQQLEDGIRLVSNLISETPAGPRQKELLTLLGTLQGLLITQCIL